MTGYVINGPADARAALQPLGAVYGIEPYERFDGLVFSNTASPGAPAAIPANGLVVAPNAKAPGLSLPDVETLPLEVRFQFADEGNDYQPATADARGLQAQKRRTLDLALPLVADRDFMKRAARDLLARSVAALNTASAALPPSLLRIEPGDKVQVPSLDADKVWCAVKTDDALYRELTLRASSPAPLLASAGARPGLGQAPAGNPGPPVIAVMDLPLLPGESGRKGPRLAAFAEPWPGDIQILDSAGVKERARLFSPAVMGSIAAPMAAGGITGRWDHATQITVQLYGGALSSAAPEEVLAGANTMAIAHASGVWEVLQFQNATLTGTGTYVLTTLLRGLAGSDDALLHPVEANALCVLLTGASQALPMQDFEIGIPVSTIVRPLGAEPGSVQESTLAVTFADRVSRLPSPVHLRASAGAGSVTFSWIRRARTGGDFWGPADIPLSTVPERYRFRVYAGALVLKEEAVSSPQAQVSDAEIDTWFPAGRPAFLDIGVAQMSPVSGAGIEIRQSVYI